MPFESQAQRRFMYATNPKMAKRFEKKTKKKNLPEKVKKSPIEIAMRLLKLDYVFPHGLPNPDEDAKPHHDLIAEISQQPVQEYGNAELDYMFQILGHPSFENEALFQKVHQEVNEREMDDVYSERHPIFTDSSMFESHRDWQDMNKSEPMDLAWRLLKNDTWGPPYEPPQDGGFEKEYFYMIARDSGIPEHEIDEAWQEALNSKAPIPNPDRHPETHPGEGHDVIMRVGRRSGPNPTSAGLGRITSLGDKNQGSFRDVRFNEETGFTKAVDLAWRLLKRETHPGESIAHFLGHDTDYFDDQDFYDRMYLDRGEGPLIHYNPKTGEGRAQLNPDARLYHPAIHPSHADENMFPDRKIVTRPDGTKEELVASSKHVLEDTKPVFDESGQLSYVETTPMPTFQNIPFSEETGFTKAERQTELGEFHEDFPSSLGPVTEYHGTMNLPAVSEQGIKARSSRKRSKKYVPEQLRGQDITYTTPDRERALAFAQERAQSLGLPSSQVGVVGVRAGGLPSPIQHQEPFGVLGGTMSNVRPSAIPRANIAPVQVLKMPQEARDYATQMHGEQMYTDDVPYMTHVEGVAGQFDDPHLKRIAYLHDVVEDTDATIEDIHERFGEDVGHAVDALTRRDTEREYPGAYYDYINRVKQHPEATKIKLADLQYNLSNTATLRESKAKQYRKAIQMLRGDM